MNFEDPPLVPEGFIKKRMGYWEEKAQNPKISEQVSSKLLGERGSEAGFDWFSAEVIDKMERRRKQNIQVIKSTPSVESLNQTSFKNMPLFNQGESELSSLTSFQPLAVCSLG